MPGQIRSRAELRPRAANSAAISATSLGVILRDDSSLSIGPGSRLVLRSFRFSPSEEKFDLVARITRGTMAYLSGLIGKLAPEKARFETPTATIGIRGTRFAVKVREPSSR